MGEHVGGGGGGSVHVFVWEEWFILVLGMGGAYECENTCVWRREERDVFVSVREKFQLVQMQKTKLTMDLELEAVSSVLKALRFSDTWTNVTRGTPVFLSTGLSQPVLGKQSLM